MPANDPRAQEPVAKPSPVETRETHLKDAPDLPYQLRLRKAQQEHTDEVREAAEKVVSPMPDPLHPLPGYVSEAKAADDKLLAEQEAQRQKDGAAAAERQGPVEDARRKLAEAEAEVQRAEQQAARR